MSVTLQQIKDEYQRHFYLDEARVIDLVLASVLSVFLPRDPVWLLVVGPSSGGKSELINILKGVQFVHEVDELTESTFLSGMNTSGDDPSLLEAIGNVGVISMKDFTSVLEMRDDKREIILSQMRHIYDGRFSKKTGNGKNPSWEGKVNFIGGVTDAVYTSGESSADMGRRTINFVLPSQDRKKTSRYAARNRRKGNVPSARLVLQSMVAEFFHDASARMQDPDNLVPLSERFSEKITDLADFVTQARTPVKRNFRGEMVMVNDFEMPMRVDNQLQTIAEALQFLYGRELNDSEERLIFKMAMDCVPKQRRMTIQHCAAHRWVGTRALATRLNMPTETVRVWLQDLNALKVIYRKGDTSTMADRWYLAEEFKSLVTEYDGVVDTGIELSDENVGYSFSEDDIDPGMIEELRKNQEELADAAFDSF